MDEYDCPFCELEVPVEESWPSDWEGVCPHCHRKVRMDYDYPLDRQSCFFAGS